MQLISKIRPACYLDRRQPCGQQLQKIIVMGATSAAMHAYCLSQHMILRVLPYVIGLRYDNSNMTNSVVVFDLISFSSITV